MTFYPRQRLICSKCDWKGPSSVGDTVTGFIFCPKCGAKTTISADFPPTLFSIIRKLFQK